jgi:hypothetical protein
VAVTPGGNGEDLAFISICTIVFNLQPIAISITRITLKRKEGERKEGERKEGSPAFNGNGQFFG